MDEELIAVLNRGGIAVLRTDTLYGIVVRADDERAVARVFDVKQRDHDKPLIVLIAKPDDAYDGAEIITQYDDSVRPTSIIVDSPHAPVWLQHSDSTVAYRVPKSEKLRDVLEQTGPLVAPSANPQGLLPARNIAEAREYFGDAIEYYVDGGEVPSDNAPSRIIRVHADGSVEIIRE